MSALIDVILPVFVVLGFGYLAARTRLMAEPAIDALMRFAQNIAAPLLLFRSIARMDLGAAYEAGLMLSFYIGAFVSFGLCFEGARLVFRRPLKDAVAIGFVGLFSNTLLLGLPITERAYGAAALTGNYAIISIHAPLLYAFGITLMEWVRTRGEGLFATRLARQTLRAIFTQPLVIGILAGFVVNLTGNPLPQVAWAAVDMIAGTAIPLALFGLGGVLARYRIEGDLGPVVMVTVAALVVHPAVTYGLGRYAFGLGDAALRSAVVTAAMAPGVNAYLFANIYGVGKRVAASGVLLATVGSILTVWGWLHLLP